VARKSLTTQTQGVSPFLRWAGSKRLLLKELASFWRPEYSRYIEPFAGSSRLFFHICPTKSILGDINKDLINTYRQLKKHPRALFKRLGTWSPDSKSYYRVRAMNPDSFEPSLRAARFIYLNRYCFNGIYRTNLNGEFNVPFGGHKSGRLPDWEALKKCSKALDGAALVCADFEDVVAKAVAGDFVYMDPPFATSSRRMFTEYDKKGFLTSDIERVRKSVLSLAERNVSFLLSYVKSPESKYLGKGFPSVTVSVKRSIAGFTGARERTPEVLIYHRAASM
jgi:DNA adenine methylase